MQSRNSPGNQQVLMNPYNLVENSGRICGKTWQTCGNRVESLGKICSKNKKCKDLKQAFRCSLEKIAISPGKTGDRPFTVMSYPGQRFLMNGSGSRASRLTNVQTFSLIPTSSPVINLKNLENLDKQIKMYGIVRRSVFKWAISVHIGTMHL